MSDLQDKYENALDRVYDLEGRLERVKIELAIATACLAEARASCSAQATDAVEARNAFTRSEARCTKLEKAVRRAIPYLVSCIHEIACDEHVDGHCEHDCPAETEDIHVKELRAALATGGDEK